MKLLKSKKKDPSKDIIFLMIARCTKMTGESIGLAIKLTAFYRVILPYLSVERQLILANLLGTASSHDPARWEFLPKWRDEFEDEWDTFQSRIYFELNQLLERITKIKTHRISANQEDDDRLHCAILASRFEEDHPDTMAIYHTLAYGTRREVRKMFAELKK